MQRSQEKQMCVAIVLMIFLYWIGVAESQAAAVAPLPGGHQPRIPGHTEQAAVTQPAPASFPGGPVPPEPRFLWPDNPKGRGLLTKYGIYATRKNKNPLFSIS